MSNRKSPASAIFQILILWFIGLTAAMQFAKFSLTFSVLRDAYPEAGTSLGLIVSIIGLVGIIFGLWASAFVSRFGFKRLLIYALILGAACSLYQSYLPDLTPMLISRVVEGLSHLVIVVAAPTMISRFSPEKLTGATMTLWSTFFGVAFTITSWIGLPFQEAYGIDAFLQVHAAAMIGLAVIAFFVIPELEIKQAATQKLNLKDLIKTHFDVYSSPYVSAPAFGWLFYTLTYVSLLTILPDLFTPETSAFYLGLLPIVSIGASMFCGVFLLTKFHAVSVAIFGFIGAAISIGFLITGIEIELVAISIFIMLGVIQSANFASIPALNKDVKDLANANGAVAQMGNLGNTTGTPILLSVLVFTGLNGLILLITLTYMCGALAHFLLAKKRASMQ
ncbi:MAG: MFS transporter [Rhizobiaceae bacterium]|nr:MFS transporter [Rhizobiaceae bacterium]